MLDYGSGWKEVWSPKPLVFAVQSLDKRVIVLPLGEGLGIREDSEIELGRCHGRGAVSQAHFAFCGYQILREQCAAAYPTRKVLLVVK